MNKRLPLTGELYHLYTDNEIGSLDVKSTLYEYCSFLIRWICLCVLYFYLNCSSQYYDKACYYTQIKKLPRTNKRLCGEEHIKT
jgi:hypothetical protein